MSNINLVDELTKLIKYKSTTSDEDACTKLLQDIQYQYESKGLHTELGVINCHPYLFASNSEPVNKLDILLQAHIDVVPAADEMYKLIVSKDKLIGRGAYDMLFAVACYNKLIAEEKLNDINVGVLLTSDEEIGGVNGVGALIKKYIAKVCILPDAGTDELLCIEAKGVLQLKLTIPGRSGHGARPWLTDSPIIKIGNVIRVISDLFPNYDNDGTTCSFTQVHGGVANNQVPSTVEVVIDIRYQPSDSVNELQQKVIEAVRPFDVEVQVADVIGESYATDTTSKYVTKFVSLYESITGNKLGTMRAPGSSDARFIAACGIPVIMCRPDGGGLHADNEWVSVPSLITYYSVLKNYILQFKQV